MKADRYVSARWKASLCLCVCSSFGPALQLRAASVCPANQVERAAKQKSMASFSSASVDSFNADWRGGRRQKSKPLPPHQTPAGIDSASFTNLNIFFWKNKKSPTIYANECKWNSIQNSNWNFLNLIRFNDKDPVAVKSPKTTTILPVNNQMITSCHKTGHTQFCGMPSRSTDLHEIMRAVGLRGTKMLNQLIPLTWCE